MLALCLRLLAANGESLRGSAVATYPQVVYEEMKMMFDRSPDPDLERIAKDFHRFYATSNWNVTQADAHHAALKMGAGQSLTRRARVSLAVGRSAYALSQSFQSSMVVLVTKDRSLLQRLYEIPEVNLCAVLRAKRCCNGAAAERARSP